MATYLEPHEETQTLFNTAIDNANLGNYLNITVVVNDRSKEMFKVVKASDLLKFRTQDDILIVINEKILDQLEPAQRAIVVEEAVCAIHFDTEHDKLTITKPDVITFSGILSKYTFETWNTIRESIKAIVKAEEDEADAKKAATEKAKADKAAKFKK